MQGPFSFIFSLWLSPLHCKHKQSKIIVLREENMKWLKDFFFKIRFCCQFEILMYTQFVSEKTNNQIMDSNTKRHNDFANAHKKPILI